MYIPEIYKNEDPADIREFIRKNSFAILVSQVNGKPWATHIPIELEVNQDGVEVLRGHISRENPQWKNFAEDSDLLVIFSGADHYISSSVYEHEDVPTWNYIAVHVYGKATVLEGDAMTSHLKKLVDRYETNSESPVTLEGFSNKTMQQTRGIVAFEIVISEIHAQRKLSQGIDDITHKKVVDVLEKTGNPKAAEIAAEMKKCPR